MGVHVDAVLDFLIHDTVQDMGTEYWGPDPDTHVNKWPIIPSRLGSDDANVPAATPDRHGVRYPCIAWNEGNIVTRYSMEAQGVYAISNLEVLLMGAQRREIGLAQVRFEDALLGISEEDPNNPMAPSSVAHHNVAGFPVTHDAMNHAPSLWI